MDAFDVLTPPNPEYRDVVRAIDVASLLVIGDDPVVTLGMATELRSLNARIRIEQVQNAGHGLPFEQPERLSEVVLITRLVERQASHASAPKCEAGSLWSGTLQPSMTPS